MISYGLVLWYINYCRLLNAKPFYTHILNIHDLLWIGFITSTLVGY